MPEVVLVPDVVLAPDAEDAEAVPDPESVDGAAAATAVPRLRAAKPSEPAMALVAASFLMVLMVVISVAFGFLAGGFPGLIAKVWPSRTPRHRAKDASWASAYGANDVGGLMRQALWYCNHRQVVTPCDCRGSSCHRTRYVIETFNPWDFCTNWAAGSEELMFTVKWPAPAADPRPCTTMFVVAFDGSCWALQCTAEVPPALLMTSAVKAARGDDLACLL